MSALAVFSFQEEHQVRVVMINGDPWFVANDICNALSIQNVTQAIARLDEDERSMFNIGRQGQANIISESGLYILILRCRDAVKQGTTAWRFRKWVTNEVLPSIRKNGEYVFIEPEPMRAAEPLNGRQKAYLRGLINDIAQSFRCRNAWISGIWLALRRACRNPSPNPITVDDLPAIAAELRRILTAAESALRNMRTYERELLRDVVRGGRRSMSCGDLPIIDINSDLEKALPAHFELAVQKLEQLSAQLKPAEITNK
ncbi:hypothetical protein EGT17_11110 [Shigella sonnei]|nr:hypothetical protein [Shigella sonnei]